MVANTYVPLMLWFMGKSSSLQQCPVKNSIGLPLSDTSNGDDESSLCGTDAILQSVRSADDVLAVVLVPVWSSTRVSCNGSPLNAGLHVVRHGDRLDVSGRTYWVASQATVDRVS